MKITKKIDVNKFNEFEINIDSLYCNSECQYLYEYDFDYLEYSCKLFRETLVLAQKRCQQCIEAFGTINNQTEGLNGSKIIS